MPAAGVVIYFVEVSSSSPIPALHQGAATEGSSTSSIMDHV